MMETSLREQLLKKIHALEAEQASLKQKISELILDHDIRPNLGSPQKSRLAGSTTKGGASNDGGQDETWCQKGPGSSGQHSSALPKESRSFCDPPTPTSGVGTLQPDLDFSELQYLNILESVGQTVCVFDFAGRIIYWNRASEILYGYSAAEALGQNVLELVVCDKEKDDAYHLMNRFSLGESWSGTISVKNKLGKQFVTFVTNSPFYDDKGSLIGVIGVGVDSQRFLQKTPIPSSKTYTSSSQPNNVLLSTKNNIESPQPLQVVIASKISNLAYKMTNKVRWKLKTQENTVEHKIRVKDSRYFDQGFSENDHRDIATPSEASLQGKGIPPMEKVSREHLRDSRGEHKIEIHKIITSRAESWFNKKRRGWSWRGSEHDGLVERTTHGISPSMNCKQEDDIDQQKTSGSYAKPELQVMDSDQSVNEASDSESSTTKASSRSSRKWNSSRSSSATGISDIGKDPLHYAILWEDLTIGVQIGRGSCGSVYHGLWRSSDVAVKVFCKLDYSDDLLHSFRQEARGMNYLHLCNPPIVHRDLKSSNLLVDKNWTVKVGDFGLSRIKHATFLTTKSGKGTAEWMAPEVIRDEPSDEKSDVYSFGVILWELATQKIPWDTLNSFQVIGTVGYMDQRLQIPEDTDPYWASLIESCWNSEPKWRPTFEELLEKLKVLQKHYAIQRLKATNTPLAQG
ncbi:hypothetical protein MKW94_005628 [Papaver nudicaule]|uniref:non-specific serine/threonine protein kinase n=1 Tax=Papaver nudicaule TaxID=74823 RepID=A0AA41VB93_PAPNU|nr:hypothetical protein [Papaver nudicaule]